MKNILDVEKSVYICTERLRGIDNCSIKFYLPINITIMEKKWKTKFVEDSFDSSDCSVFEISIKKWYDAELERLASKVDKDDDNLYLFCDPEINEGSVCCEDYTIRFNRDERVIDLVINSEEGSPVWKDVVYNVPARFASCLGDPVGFLYRLSTNTSEEKEFYGFVDTEHDAGILIHLTEFNPVVEWKAENFDSLISSMYNIF